MSTNLEYKERERRRQASEAKREKGRQRYRARHKKRRRFFLLVAAVTKCERPTIKYKVKMSGGEKK